MIADIDGAQCQGVLLARERRGALTDSDRIALDAHLVACASCRMSREVIADFDAADVVDVQDGARIRALSDAARRTRGAGAPARRRVRFAAAAAAVLIFGGTASAAVWMWRRPPASPPAALERATVATVSPPAPRARALVAHAANDGTAPAAAAIEAPRAAIAHARPASATSLLRQASDARRAGDLERAIALYRKLQRDFAVSPEAVLSTVPLGRLLLQAGSARAALAQFDRYLAAAAGGTLVPEALYGRARALAELGERAEERRSWQRLTAEFPGSAYAPMARRRAAELP